MSSNLTAPTGTSGAGTGTAVFSFHSVLCSVSLRDSWLNVLSTRNFWCDVTADNNTVWLLTVAKLCDDVVGYIERPSLVILMLPM